MICPILFLMYLFALVWRICSESELSNYQSRISAEGAKVSILLIFKNRVLVNIWEGDIVGKCEAEISCRF